MSRLRTLGEGWVVKLTGLIPHPLLANPERVLLNLAVFFLGIAALFPAPGSTAAEWDDEVAWTWGITMMIGGFAGLAGHWTEFRPAERVGALAVGLGSLALGVYFVAEYGTQRIPSAIIFFGIFIAKMVRLLRTSAVRFAVRRHLRELDEHRGME